MAKNTLLGVLKYNPQAVLYVYLSFGTLERIEEQRHVRLHPMGDGNVMAAF
jgi:hypothetical protein